MHGCAGMWCRYYFKVKNLLCSVSGKHRANFSVTYHTSIRTTSICSIPTFQILLKILFLLTMLAWLFSPFRATRDVIQGQQYINLRTYQGYVLAIVAESHSDINLWCRTSASAPGTTAPRNSRPIADHVWDNYKSKRSFFILQWIFYTQKWFRKNWGAWKTGLIINVLTTLLVLILNLSVPAWAARKYGTEGSYLYRGSCPQTERAGVIVDASINISGTLLLSASNYTMQILSAPTRKDVDRAHEKGTLLTIGLQSFNNLRLISIYRKVLWGLLAFSSIPLHLMSDLRLSVL